MSETTVPPPHSPPVPQQGEKFPARSREFAWPRISRAHLPTSHRETSSKSCDAKSQSQSTVPYLRACIRSFGSLSRTRSDHHVQPSQWIHPSYPPESGGSPGTRKCPGKLTKRQVLSRASGAPPSNEDVEGTLSTANSDADPFGFRGGIRTDEELIVLRQRKKGKPLEKYHRKQNEVRSSLVQTLRP